MVLDSPLTLDEALDRLSKVELHCHIEGTMRPATLVELAERGGLALPTRDPGELYRYDSLDGFLEVFWLAQSCLQTRLSPDGAYLACLRNDFSLALLEVSSGQALWQKQNFIEYGDYWSYALLIFGLDQHAGLVRLAFSPEGRYFLAGSINDDFAYDLQLKHAVNLPAKLRNILHLSFAFLGPDRIVGIDRKTPLKSPVLRFPSGERLSELQLADSVHVGSPSHGNFVMVWPLRDHPLGVMSIDTGNMMVRFERAAGDIYDNWVITESVDGKLSLLDLAQKKEIASVQLAQSPLGALTAVSVSSGLQWLAVSSRTRGAVFDMVPNIRLYYTRSFHGAWFSEDDVLYADFPKFEKEERKVVKVDLSAAGAFTPIEELENTVAAFSGSYLLVEKPQNPKSWERKNWTYEIQDYRTKKTIWSRHFPAEVPMIFMSPSKNTALILWGLYSSAARDELQRFPDLKSKGA